ncbi:OmpA family protein [Candidatus Poribacteria bacterium]|nr:OmpA family protein [Candidatus Poribacteria bacterium]
MRSIAGIAIVSIFVFSVILSGCGKLSKEEFAMEMDKYNQENSAAHTDLGNQVSELSGKVDAQGDALRSEVSMAKEAAITASQQGDADTIAAAKEAAESGDAKLREELMQTANMVEEKAQQASMSGDQKLQDQIAAVEDTNKMQAQKISDLEAALMETKKSLAATKEMAAAKPMIVVTVQFPSGKIGLTAAAMEALDKAVAKIQSSADASVLVKGHADGSPVLAGRYRSNWDLSQARADSVVQYLKSKGVTNTIRSRGLGHTEPIGPVNTKAGRAQNRRAEIILLPAGSMM